MCATVAGRAGRVFTSSRCTVFGNTDANHRNQPRRGRGPAPARREPADGARASLGEASGTSRNPPCSRPPGPGRSRRAGCPRAAILARRDWLLAEPSHGPAEDRGRVRRNGLDPGRRCSHSRGSACGIGTNRTGSGGEIRRRSPPPFQVAEKVRADSRHRRRQHDRSRASDGFGDAGLRHVPRCGSNPHRPSPPDGSSGGPYPLSTLDTWSRGVLHRPSRRSP